MKKIIVLFFALAAYHSARPQIVVSAIMPNPAGTDSAYEYVQLLATQHIDFAATPFSVIVCNNGTAGAAGWLQGGNSTYKFNLTSGTVNTGEVFYVGGNRKRINGPGSTDLSGELWIRDINTVTTDGDGAGLHNVTGVMGNAGLNADGVAVFQGISPDSSSVPVDAIFYGAAVGGAYTGVNGYQVPDNDHYLHGQGMFGQGSNNWFVFIPGNARDTLIKLAGVYDTVNHSWTSPRNAVMNLLFLTSPPSALETQIVLSGQPSAVPESQAGLFHSFYNPGLKTIELREIREEHCDYLLQDVTGRILASGSMQGKEFSIDVSAFPKGIQLLTVSAGTKKNTAKIVIY
jgi:hypothetical protein